MDDMLYNAAKTFQNLLKYDYHFILGDSKRRKKFCIIINKKDMFNHVCGLDHLQDIPKVTTNKSAAKVAIYKNILENKITFDDISNSSYLNVPVSNNINPDTGTNYTIYDRIVHMAYLVEILDNSLDGKFYQWDYNKTKDRYCRIRADYVLAVPSKNHGHNHYFFLNELPNKKMKNSEYNSISTILLSAFSDGDELISNLAYHMTVLEVIKIDNKNNDEIIRKTRPSYQKEKQKELLMV